MGVLREIFGPSKEPIWEKLTREIGGEYHDEQGFFKKGKVVLSHRQWDITLDTYTDRIGKTTVIFTRMRAPYVNRDGFRFDIYRRSLFSDIDKLLGLQKDIQVGDSYFDDNFVIQGEEEHMVRALLANRTISQLIKEQPHIHFQVKDDEGWFSKKFPDGVDELYFEVSGVIRDKERLKKLFDLFALVLDELCRLGSAYEDDPNVTFV